GIANLWLKPSALLPQSRSASDQPAQTTPQGRARPIVLQCFDCRATGRQCIERDVDPVERRIVFRAILDVVDDLKRGTQGIRGGPSVPRLPVHVEYETPDRHGGARTVVNQFI